MREILFRGKTDSGRWAYGNLIWVGTFCCILESEENVHPSQYPFLEPDLGIIDGYMTPVIATTLCQFTGLLDKNGTKIFEGDIMHCYGNVVEFCNGDYCINGDSPLSFWTGTEIIGNIYDAAED